MNIDFYLAKADRLPAWQATLEDANGAPIPLNTGLMSISLFVRDIATGTTQVNSPAALTGDGTDGKVIYTWSGADITALITGFYEARWVILYTNGKQLSVPNTGWLILKVDE